MSQPRTGQRSGTAIMHETVFLFDVDNTLLDNDAVVRDLRAFLTATVGRTRQAHYFALFEQIRAEVGYADYLEALQRFRLAYPREPHLLAVSTYLVNYPFADRLYPGALAAIAHVRRWGPAVVLSDGDVVFQPRKVERSGILDAVHGQVLIYVHKECMLDDVAHRYPARHYVMIDDKLRLLAAIKRTWAARVTTVFVRQGHYALDPAQTASYPAADVSLERIGDLLTLHPPDLAAAGPRQAL